MRQKGSLFGLWSGSSISAVTRQSAFSGHNARLHQFARDGGAEWVDFATALCAPDGAPDLRLLPDGVHLSTGAYRLWAVALRLEQSRPNQE